MRAVIRPVPGKHHVRRLVTFRPLTTRRFLLPVALLVVLLAAAAGTTVYRAGGRTVSLSVDGSTRTVSLRGSTVQAVLTKAGVVVGSHDLLAPSLGSPVTNGSRIVLRHGRQMTMVVDGAKRTVWVTATSVDEALGQLDLRLGGAVVSADRSRQIPLKGFSLDIRTRKDVRLVVAGKVRLVATTGLAVQDAFRAARIAVRPTDRLSVPLRSRLHNGQVVTLTRLDHRRVAQDTILPFGTVRRADNSRYVGTTAVLSAGRSGNRRTTYLVSFVNGHPAGRRIASVVQTSNPVSRVVAVGSKARPVPVAAPAPAPAPARRRAAAPARPTSSGSSGGLNWGALAACESGGNPRAVSSSGTYRGLYQFSIGTWQSVGGSGDPIDASPSEQTNRAQILYSRTGRSSWPVCGAYL